MGPVLCAEAGESEGRGEADKNAAEGSGPAAAGHARTLQVTPTTPDSFFSNSGKATPNEEAAALGEHKRSVSLRHSPQGLRNKLFLSR